MNIFELTIPRTEHQKKSTLPLFSRRPSIHRSNIAIENASKTPPRKKKRRLTADKNYAMKSNSSIFHSTTNEKRTIDPLPWILRRRRKFEKEEKKINWKNDIPASSTCLYVVHTIHTYMHTWYLPTIHIWGHSVYHLSSKSQSKRKVRAKNEKKKRKQIEKKEILFLSYLPYLGTLAFFFLSFSFEVYWCTGTCRYLPTLYSAVSPFFRVVYVESNGVFNWSDI